MSRNRQQLFASDPLELTNHLAEPVNLRDVWRNSSAFLVFSGTSLNDLPTEKLSERGVLSMGLNNVCGHVHTTAFTANDPSSKFHHGIFLDPKMWKFLPTPRRGRKKGKFRIKDEHRRWHWAEQRVADCPTTFFFRRNMDFNPETFFTTNSANCGNNANARRKNSRDQHIFSPFMCFRLMYYLGVRELFILGMDFQMSKSQPYAFAQKKEIGGVTNNNQRYKLTDKWLHELRPEMEKRGYRVYNCNERSGCTAFRYVPFDEAYDRVKGGVPQEPFDLAGFYETKKYVGDPAQKIVDELGLHGEK